MLLYHGSNTDIKAINPAMCRPYKDFGQGFYLTAMEEQAKKMADRVARIYGGAPVLNVYEIDDDMLSGMLYKKTTNQYSFHTVRAIRLLRKVDI
ncbi:MAG: DUF3990 domain-containing protein [Lachnospiraceae bacterium]|nr:DUF3990 domain-containing protein [Lachnospiraceae bacterium]